MKWKKWIGRNRNHRGALEYRTDDIKRRAHAEQQVSGRRARQEESVTKVTVIGQLAWGAHAGPEPSQKSRGGLLKDSLSGEGCHSVSVYAAGVNVQQSHHIDCLILLCAW